MELIRMICLHLTLFVSDLDAKMSSIAFDRNMDRFTRTTDDLAVDEYVAYRESDLAQFTTDVKIIRHPEMKIKASSSILWSKINHIERKIASVLWETLKKKECHIILLTFNSRQHRIASIISYGFLVSQPVIIIDLGQLNKDAEQSLPDKIWGSPSSNCRILLVDYLSDFSSSLFRFLESSKLWMWPSAQIILVGDELEISSILSHSTLRNTINPLLLSVREEKLHRTGSSLDLPPPRLVVSGYGRCLYCNNGQAKVLRLFHEPLEAMIPGKLSLPFDQHINFHGKVFRMTAFNYFPYIDSKLDSSEYTNSKVTLLDSLDNRFLKTLSAHANFTVEASFPDDRQPGYLTPNGTWTGMIGALVDDLADLTSQITVTPQRAQVLDLERTCDIDPVVIVSLVPQVLPRYLVITRPFTADVWIYLLLSIVVWGISLWVLQKTSRRLGGTECMSLDETIFYGLAVILDDPPKPVADVSGQVLVGWWLIACFLIANGYRSALVANLTVESKEKPIDSYEDLVKQAKWGWGFEQMLLRGSPAYYFKYNPDPTVQYIYQYLEGIDSIEALEKVKKGRYSFLATLNRVTSLIGIYHTDDFGRNPFYIGRAHYKLGSHIGNGFRKGAPFRHRFSQLINRLIDAGIINYWIKDVIREGIKVSRKENLDKQKEGRGKYSSSAEKQISLQIDDTKVVLRMAHLIGVFFIFILGHGIALLTIAIEIFVSRYAGRPS